LSRITAAMKLISLNTLAATTTLEDEQQKEHGLQKRIGTLKLVPPHKLMGFVLNWKSSITT